MIRRIIICLFLVPAVAWAQLPKELLSGRSCALYSTNLSTEELAKIQQYFQRIGIDAIMYVDRDSYVANVDVKKAFHEAFIKREILNLIEVEKLPQTFRLTVSSLNGETTKAVMEEATLSLVMQELYRKASSGQKRRNFLIPDIPETEYVINFIKGRRNDFFALDLKTDGLAIVLSGNESEDSKLREFFDARYPFKFAYYPPGTDDKTIRQSGSNYVIGVLYGPGRTLKKLLGLTDKGERNYLSKYYQQRIEGEKIIPAMAPVFKIYIRQLATDNVFVGTKWDADTQLDQALENHFTALKIQLNIN